MVLINYAGREINAKIVYYGPGLSGKTTNLECIYASVPPQLARQDGVDEDAAGPHALLRLPAARTRARCTGSAPASCSTPCPGQVFYNATRKLVLKGADAVVFVADSGLGKMDENRESLRNLDENLREQGLSLDTLPFVLQYNKRDLPQVYSIEELKQALNPRARAELRGRGGERPGRLRNPARGVAPAVPAPDERSASAGAVAPAHRRLASGGARPAAAPSARPVPPARCAPASRRPCACAPAGVRGPRSRAAPRPAGRRRAATPAAAPPQARASGRGTDPTLAGAARPERRRPAAERAAGYDAGPRTSRPSRAPLFGDHRRRADVADPRQRRQHDRPERRAGRGVARAEYYDLRPHRRPVRRAAGPEADAPSPSGFIKDPLRRVDRRSRRLARRPRRAPARTQHVSVVVSRGRPQAGRNHSDRPRLQSRALSRAPTIAGPC